jgi:Putative DNA-binding domain
MDTAELEALLDEIRNGRGEGHALELKEKWWDFSVQKSRDEFVRDVAALANANTNDAKVILVGVDAAGKVNDSPLPEDEANLQQRLQAIAPVPHVVFRPILVPAEQVTVTAIELHEPFDKPYVARVADRHTVFVRQGSTTATATRGMLDRWYEGRVKPPELRLLVDGQDIRKDPRVLVTKPRYVSEPSPVDPLFAHLGLHVVPIRMPFQSDPAEDAKLKNQTHWLRMSVENVGEGSTSQLVADFQIDPADSIHLSDSRGLSVARRVWQTDPNENCYVESHADSGGQAHARQRIRQINPKTIEHMVPLGLIMPEGDGPPGYRVRYRITDSRGIQLEGEFRVQIVWSGEEVVKPEARPRI